MRGAYATEENTDAVCDLYQTASHMLGPIRNYVANDGSTTHSRSHAARFWTFWDAKAFVAVNHMALNALTYIGREDFSRFRNVALPAV